VKLYRMKRGVVLVLALPLVALIGITSPAPAIAGKPNVVVLFIDDLGWKLVHLMNQNETELYRLEEDEGERDDLAEKEPEKARELLQTLNKWVKETVRR
jgi:hypothetical protein